MELLLGPLALALHYKAKAGNAALIRRLTFKQTLGPHEGAPIWVLATPQNVEQPLVL